MSVDCCFLHGAVAVGIEKVRVAPSYITQGYRVDQKGTVFRRLLLVVLLCF